MKNISDKIERTLEHFECESLKAIALVQNVLPISLILV